MTEPLIAYRMMVLELKEYYRDMYSMSMPPRISKRLNKLMKNCNFTHGSTNNLSHPTDKQS